jgi:hypothetical protein
MRFDPLGMNYQQNGAAVGAVMQTPNVNAPGKGVIPFRKATTERTTQLVGDTITFGASLQKNERILEGSGFIYGIMLHAQATAAGNSANVTFAEDAPWNVFDTVVFGDVNGDLHNVQGFELFLCNLVNRNYAFRYLDNAPYVSVTPGTPATGGSFEVWVRVPVAINRRDLLGIVANQDRAQKYRLRNDVAASSVVYGTGPTVVPSVVIERFYENYSIPLATGPNGEHQQMVPDSFGTLAFLTSTTAAEAPNGAGTVNHFLRRIGNTVRYIILIWRINGVRATVELAGNNPTSVRFRVGEDQIFIESYRYRRTRMFEQWGFDFPAGVLVYDAMHDFAGAAGMELGDDYYSTQSLVNAQFEVVYPAGFGSTNNTLRFVTSDVMYVPPQAAVGVAA